MNYICPKCKEFLYSDGKIFKCTSGHSYDISKDGYVNLLLPTKNNTGIHGDNKMMVRARRDFLELGHYENIIKIITEIIRSGVEKQVGKAKSPIILDAGCGEGYYTEGISKELENKSVSHEIYGIDVSKEAVKYAVKRRKSIPKEQSKSFYSVASVNSLPFADKSFDYVISLFAPLSEKEFSRVLKDDGILITVSPSENHLYGLKEQIYETPYKNPPSTFHPELFTLKTSTVYENKIVLDNNTDIKNLFSMTPYYYNSKSGELDKLSTLNRLETGIGFVFNVFIKTL